MIKKLLKVTGISLVILFAILLILPMVFKGKLVRMIKDMANEQLLADVDFDENISLSLIKRFPEVSLGISDISVVGQKEFSGDTLFYAKRFEVAIDVMSIIRGDQMELKRLWMRDPVLHFIINEEGKGNWEITAEDTTVVETEEESAFSLSIKSVKMNNAAIRFEHKDIDFDVSMFGMNYQMSGDFSLEEFPMKMKADIQSMYMRFDGMPLIHKAKAVIDSELHMDLNKFKFSFLDNVILLNELELTLDGWMQMNDDDMDFDMSFGAVRNEFRHFLSLIPAIYATDMKDLQSSGYLALNGFLRGKMTDDDMPGFGVMLQVDNGYFKYAQLPMSVDDVQIKLEIDNVTGQDKDFVLDLSKFSLTAANNPFGMQLNLKNLENPSVSGWVDGKWDFGKIKQFIPLDGIDVRGLLTSDLKFKGLISKMELATIDQVNASGQLSLRDFKYADVNEPLALYLDKFDLNFTPQRVEMPYCKGRYGDNDFDVKGNLSNFFGYMLSDGVLDGQLVFNAKHMNLHTLFASTTSSETSPATAATTTDTSALNIEIPTRIDFMLQAQIDQLLFDKMNISNINGKIHLHEGVMHIQQAGMEWLGGKMVLNGFFDGKDPKTSFSQMDFNLKGFDIPKAAREFGFLGKYAPFASKMTGLFNMDFSMTTSMDQQMNVDYQSFNSKGSIGLTNATIGGVKLMNMLADQLKVEKFRTLELKNQMLKFKVERGQFILDSTMFTLWDNTRLTMGGSTSIDGQLQYMGFISMPRNDLGVVNQSFDQLLSQATSKGLQIQMDKTINIAMSITGSVTDPKVKLELRETMEGLSQSVKQQLIDQAKDKVEDLKKDLTEKLDAGKQEALKKATEEAERILTLAQNQANTLTSNAKKSADVIRKEGGELGNKIRKEAQNQADDLMKNARNPLEKAAAQRGADRLITEADRRARQVEDEKNKAADKIEQTAQTEADKVMDEARKRADETLEAVKTK
jgi:hypothetical protein